MDRLKIPFRMHSSGWLSLGLCVLFGIGAVGLRLGFVTGVAFAACLLLHEVGHMLAAIVLRVPVREFGLTLLGAYTRRAYARCGKDEIIISAAGPLMNLFLALPLLYVPVVGKQLALCNLLLGVVNLLPLPSSDGLRILRTLFNRTGNVIPVRSQPFSTSPDLTGTRTTLPFPEAS